MRYVMGSYFVKTSFTTIPCLFLFFYYIYVERELVFAVSKLVLQISAQIMHW